MFIASVIVLRSFMFSDSKMMVEVLSREEGIISCVLRIGRSKAARARRQIFQPLSLLELTLERKSSGQLATIKDAHISQPFSTIPFDPYKLSISMFLAEFIRNAMRSEREVPLLFDYVSESTLWLDNATTGFSNFHLVFMMRLTRFIGFYPNLDGYREGYCFDMQNGCFVAAAPSVRGFLGAKEAQTMQLLMRMNYGNMQLFKMSHTERNRCLDVILDYYRLHVPDFGELKSLSVLRELFA